MSAPPASNPFSPDFLQKDWREEDHPRTDDGKFTQSGSLVGPAAPTTAAPRQSSHIRADLETVYMGKVTTLENLHAGSSSAVYDAHFENGSRAVFKPDHLAPAPADLGRVNFNGKDDVAPSVREAMAFRLDQLMEFGLVPPTASRDFDKVDDRELHMRDVTGSVQAWVDGETAGHSEHNYAMSPDLPKLAALDFVMGQTDRHGGNFMVTKVGDEIRLAAIDNGLAFPNAIYDRQLFSRPLSLVWDGGGVIPSQIRNAAKNVDIGTLETMMRSHGFQENTIEGVTGRLSLLRDSASWDELKTSYYDIGRNLLYQGPPAQGEYNTTGSSAPGPGGMTSNSESSQ